MAEADNPFDEELRNEIARLARSLFDRGFSVGSAGNISTKTSDGGMLITPTNSSFGNLDPDQISKLDADGRHVSGKPPSKELFFHQAVYRARPDDAAIVHLHSTHCVGLSCMDGLDPDDLLPPLTPYFVMRVGQLRLVPYHPPGDEAIADPVFRTALKGPALLIENHGPIVSAKSLNAAVSAAEELEETARLFFLLGAHRSKALNQEQVDELRRRYPL